MLKKFTLTAFAALATAIPASTPASSQITILHATMGVGSSNSGEFNFATGAEVLAICLRLTDDILVGSGNEGQFNTLGSEADTEIAVYGRRGHVLWSANDDGATGSWGDPEFSSVLPFGDGEVGNGDQYAGLTAQGNPCPENLDLVADKWALIVSTYSTYWDEERARRSETGTRDTGLAFIELYFQ